MRSCILMIFFLATIATVYSQKLISEFPDQDWRIIPGQYYGKNPGWDVYMYPAFKNSDGDFSSSIVTLNETEAVALVTFNGKEYGVIKVNDNLKTIWKSKIPGEPNFLAKFYNNFIVLTTTGTMFNRDMELLIVDGKNGKIIKQRKWGDETGLNLKGDLCIFYPLSNEESGEYRLGIRFVEKKENRITRGMNIVTFNENFDVVSNDKIPLVNSDLFVNCSINKKGDFFFLSSDDAGRFTAQSFKAKTWMPGEKVSFSVDPRNKSKYSAYIFPSSTNEEQAFVSLNYINQDKDKAHLIGKLDFSSGKSFIHEVVPNKQFLNSAKKIFIEVNKDFNKPDYDNWDNMHFTGLAEIGDRIALVREVRLSYTSNSNHRYWVTGDALVSVLNSNMQPVTDLIIPKRFRLNAPVGVSSSIHVKDNLLYVISSSDKGAGRSAIVSTIDVQQAKVNTIEQIKKTNIKSGHPADPQATLWFKDSFVISYLDADAVMLRIASVQANLQKFAY